MTGPTNNNKAPTEVPVVKSEKPHPNYQKSFDYVMDVSKNILLLSTGVIATTATLINALISPNEKAFSFLLMFAWVALLASVIAGVVTQYGLTTELIKPANEPPPSIESDIVKKPAKVQLVCFVFGVALIVFWSIGEMIVQSDEKKTEMAEVRK